MSHNALIHAGGWLNGYVVQPLDYQTIDLLLFKSINGDDGGTWAPSAAIVIGGAGLRANDLTVTNELDVTSDAQFSGDVDFLGSSSVWIHGGATATWNAGGAAVWQSGSSATFDSGSLVTIHCPISITGGSAAVIINAAVDFYPSAITHFQSGSQTTFDPGAYVTFGGGANVAFGAGANVAWAAGSQETFDAGSLLSSHGTVSITGGSAAVIINAPVDFYPSTVAHFQSGSATTFDSGSALTAAPGSTTVIAGALTIGPTSLTGVVSPGADGRVLKRRIGGVNADVTYSVLDGDIVQIPTLTGNHIYTISSFAAVDGDRMTFTMAADSVTLSANGITLQRTDTSDIGPSISKQAGGFVAMTIIFNGMRWDPEIWAPYTP